MSHRRGFAMIEAILATATVGGLTVAALSMASTAAVERRISAERAVGHSLAKQMVEELAALPVIDPEAEDGASVGSYVDEVVGAVDDILDDLGLGGAAVDASVSVGVGVDASDVVPVRTAYNEIVDYAGWSSSPPRGREGAAVPNSDGWTRAVEVTEVSAADLDGVEVGGTGVYRIRVMASVSGRVAGEVVIYRTTAGDGALR